MNRPNQTGVEAAPDAAVDELTPREREILAGLTLRLSNRAIAARLYLAEKSVKNRVTGIFNKLRVKNRRQAADWALRNGLDGKDTFPIEEAKRKKGP